jgi:predicted GNAT family acetyltransferase
MINLLVKINMIKKYCNDFEKIEFDDTCTDDEVRVQGINLI